MLSLRVCATQWHTNATRTRSRDRVGHGLPSPCHHLPPSTRTPLRSPQLPRRMPSPPPFTAPSAPAGTRHRHNSDDVPHRRPPLRRPTTTHVSPTTHASRPIHAPGPHPHVPGPLRRAWRPPARTLWPLRALLAQAAFLLSHCAPLPLHGPPPPPPPSLVPPLPPFTTCTPACHRHPAPLCVTALSRATHATPATLYATPPPPSTRRRPLRAAAASGASKDTPRTATPPARPTPTACSHGLLTMPMSIALCSGAGPFSSAAPWSVWCTHGSARRPGTCAVSASTSAEDAVVLG
jgi:hypothetical protein